MNYKDMSFEEKAKDMIEWFAEAEHYSVVHYAVERGMSKQELFVMASDSPIFQKALDYAFSVQEFKVLEGAISGSLDRAAALKMLETYNGWKSDVSIYQKVEQTVSPEMADRLATAIEKLDVIGKSLDDNKPTDKFGEVELSICESARSIVDGK